MNTTLRNAGFGALLVGVALLSSCASDKSESTAAPPQAQQAAPAKKGGRPEYVANPTKVKFGEFKRAELKLTALPEKFRNNKGNQEHAKRIDEMLLAGLKPLFPELTVVPAGGDFSKPAERTLQISPNIKEIRLVSVGSRVWLGAMAGGSDLVMQVVYRDSSTGEVIADPDFWKGNNAWAGGWSFGSSDNQIRDGIVNSIVNYTSGNK
jgi:hypothetical protein